MKKNYIIQYFTFFAFNTPRECIIEEVQIESASSKINCCRLKDGHNCASSKSKYTFVIFALLDVPEGFKYANGEK